MTVRTGEIHLAHALLVECRAAIEMLTIIVVDDDLAWQSSRLVSNVRGECDQLGGFILEC